MINHIELNYNDTELIDLILGVASGEINDGELLLWLQMHII
jgi:hypothetical protein